jgi:hypothetical protein
MTLRPFVCLLVAAATAACSSPADPEELRVPAPGYSEPPRWADLGVDCAPDAPATSLDPSLRDALPPPPPNIDTEWADIARRVPGGWGGFFYEDGTPTIYLVDPSQREAAAAALRDEGIPMPSSGSVKQGRWDFAQLHDWYRYLAPHIRIEGTSFSDINEVNNRLEYGAIDEATRARMEEIAASLGVPCYLVAIAIRPYATAL